MYFDKDSSVILVKNSPEICQFIKIEYISTGFLIRIDPTAWSYYLPAGMCQFTKIRMTKLNGYYIRQKFSLGTIPGLLCKAINHAYYLLLYRLCIGHRGINLYL